jgi:AcrR family transcriptional regulator
VSARPSTKDRIASAAVELFNASGVGPVTTNHIAAHLGISPGNLYYHFANKEEIVREAFERMNAEADVLWQPPQPDNGFDPFALQRIVVGNLQLYGRYLFFARELTSLLRADPVLRERYSNVAERRMEQLVAVLQPLVLAGLLTNVGDDDDLRALAESAWLVGLFCVPYAETVDVASPPGRSARARALRTQSAIERGALLVLHLFKPYMDPFAYSALGVLVRNELESAGDKTAALRGA